MEVEKQAIDYIERHPYHADILRTLKSCCLEVGLMENIIWGTPVYAHQSKYIAGISSLEGKRLHHKYEKKK